MRHLFLAFKLAIPLSLAAIAMGFGATQLMIRYFGMTNPPSVIYPVAVVMLIFVPVLAIISAVHQRQIGEHRGISRDEFVSVFGNVGVPADIPGAVYDYYKSQVFAKGFSVAPDDEYEQVLSEGDAEIHGDAMALMKALGMKKPLDYAAKYSETPIRTLRDMVLWLDWVRQHQAMSDKEQRGTS